MTGQELKDIYNTSGITGEAFAERLNVSRARLYQIFKEAEVSQEIIDKLSIPVVKPHKGVPVYDIDFTAGNVTKFEEFQERIIGYVDLNGFKNCIAFVKVKGNSMFPTFTAGDIVGLEPMEDISIIEYGQPFGVVTKSGQNMIKFIRKGEDENNLILRSSSKDHDDIPIHKKQILKLYKAHGPIRNTFY